MKIGFILNPGIAVSGMSNGVLKQATTWAKGLRDLGHEVKFIGPDENGKITALKEFDIIHFFQHGYWLKSFLNTDIFKHQVWFFTPTLDCTKSLFIYSLIAKIPINHYLLVFGPRLLNRFCQKCTVNVVSKHECKYIKKISPKCKIVRNPIAVPISDGESVKPCFDIPKKFVLFVGGVSQKRKNIFKLIDACELINIPLVLVGSKANNELSVKIDDKIKQSKIPVFVLGFVEISELRWLYKNCSVFCLPSLIEGVGQVALEALYFGAPVAITSVGGPPDYFDKYAEYVDPNSVQSIASGISRAFENKHPIDDIRRYLENFSTHNVACQLSQSYKESLA